uniref:uncharacterized protein LOC122587937 n=1 Tax=Erigeron canadensis TaxID=72917 RepID=UPI001CB939A1|nr:uncharacterized protein LOC122587937 [Erigeron canadensis]
MADVNNEVGNPNLVNEEENVLGTSISKLDFGDKLYLHASDTIGTPLISFKLKGTENYKVWACAMELALETKNKMGFIIGTCEKPLDNDILAKQWDRCNSVVLSWILSSVTEELYLGQIFSKNAKIVWDKLKETYDKVDGSIIFNIHHKINTLTQNGAPLSEYYHKLNSLWKQYDAIVKLPVCTCNAAKEIQEHQNLLKLMQFLMGLDDVYLPMRSSMLTKDPLPTVKVAFALISREESHRGISTHDNNSRPHNSGFAARFSENGRRNFANRFNHDNRNNNRIFENRNFENRNFENRRNLNTPVQCQSCHKYGHTQEKCFEIVGYPPGYGRNSFARKINNSPFQRNMATNNAMAPGNHNNHGGPSTSSSSNAVHSNTDNSPVFLTHFQYSKLMNLLNEKTQFNSQSHSKGAHANMAGIFYNSNPFFNANFNKFFCSNAAREFSFTNLGWISDFGANQHMTCNEEDLINVEDISMLGLTVGHPNGTQAKILKIGDLWLTENILLFGVLCVLEYCVNLISVHCLARDSKLSIGFDENFCYIQDLNSRKVIGSGKQNDGLYIFQKDVRGRKPMCNYANFQCNLSKQTWHNRLGHPSDPVLFNLKDKLKLDLQNSPSTSLCEICHRAKQIREPFPKSVHNTLDLGDVVHIDL